MIDNFSLGLTHGLMLLAAWRLLSRLDLDSEILLPAESPAVSQALDSRPDA